MIGTLHGDFEFVKGEEDERDQNLTVHDQNSKNHRTNSIGAAEGTQKIRRCVDTYVPCFAYC
jgi:hypothetical protein